MFGFLFSRFMLPPVLFFFSFCFMIGKDGISGIIRQYWMPYGKRNILLADLRFSRVFRLLWPSPIPRLDPRRCHIHCWREICVYQHLFKVCAESEILSFVEEIISFWYPRFIKVIGWYPHTRYATVILSKADNSGALGVRLSYEYYARFRSSSYNRK